MRWFLGSSDDPRDSPNKPQRHDMKCKWWGDLKCTRSHRVSRRPVGRRAGYVHMCAFAMHSQSCHAFPVFDIRPTWGARTHTGRTQSQITQTTNLSQRNADSQTHTGPGHDPGRRPGANPAADSVSEEATPANPTLVTLPPPTPRAHLPGVTTVGIKIRWHQPCAAVDSACAQAEALGLFALFLFWLS